MRTPSLPSHEESTSKTGGRTRERAQHAYPWHPTQRGRGRVSASLAASPAEPSYTEPYKDISVPFSSAAPPPPPRPVDDDYRSRETAELTAVPHAAPTEALTPSPCGATQPSSYGPWRSSPMTNVGPSITFPIPTPSIITVPTVPGPAATTSSAASALPPPWGGLRAGHPLPPGARKSCPGLATQPPLRSPAPLPTTSVAADNPHRESTTHSADRASSLCEWPAQRDPMVRQTDRPLAKAQPTTPHRPSEASREAAASGAPDERQTPDAPQKDADTMVFKLPVPPVRPSLHQRRLGGPGSFTTLFITHLPAAVTTGMHLEPFVPSEGLVRISVKRVHGQDAAFAQYATTDAAFNALMWIHQRALQRVVVSSASSAAVISTHMPVVARTEVSGTSYAAGSVTAASAVVAPNDWYTGNANSSSNGGGVGGAEEGVGTGLDAHGSKEQRQSACPPATPGVICSTSPLQGAALCEAIASLTANLAVELRNRYALPVPYRVAQQLASQDHVRLAYLQSMVPVVCAEWSNKVERGRHKPEALQEQIQDYGRALSPLAFEPVPAPLYHGHTQTTMATDGGSAARSSDANTAARTVFIRARRDYALFYCDGGERCRGRRADGVECALSPSAEAGDPAPAVTDPTSDGRRQYRLCDCLMQEAHAAERSEFVFVAQLLRPHFFSVSFAGMSSFRAFLEPPFRGGCFVRFQTADMARECADWFWQQPHVVALLEVQMARQETLKQ